MIAMTKTPYTETPITAWNVNHFLAWLADETKQRFGVDYQPGGHGSVAARWSMERGMLKQAQLAYGNDVLRRFIERCLDDYRSTAKYPAITFTFMWSYRRNELQRAQADVARVEHDKQRQLTTSDDDIDLSQFI